MNSRGLKSLHWWVQQLSQLFEGAPQSCLRGIIMAECDITHQEKQRIIIQKTYLCWQEKKMTEAGLWNSVWFNSNWSAAEKCYLLLTVTISIDYNIDLLYSLFWVLIIYLHKGLVHLRLVWMWLCFWPYGGKTLTQTLECLEVFNKTSNINLMMALLSSMWPLSRHVQSHVSRGLYSGLYSDFKKMDKIEFMKCVFDIWC